MCKIKVLLLKAKSKERSSRGQSVLRNSRICSRICYAMRDTRYAIRRYAIREALASKPETNQRGDAKARARAKKDLASGSARNEAHLAPPPASATTASRLGLHDASA